MNVSELDQQAAVMEAELAFESKAHAPKSEAKKRGRPAGAKNKPKFDAQGNIIPLKKELAANKVPGKRGRPKGSKNETKVDVSVVDVQVETKQDDTFVLPIGAQ